MSVVHRAILRLLLVVSGVVWVGTVAGAESQVFKAAEQEFVDGFYQRAETDFADFTTLEEHRLMSIDPRMSYVSKETIAGDPDFWAPKPKPAAMPKKKQ